MNVEIVRILMRNFNTILLKYQIDRINDQKSIVCRFDACDPSFELPGLVRLKHASMQGTRESPFGVIAGAFLLCQDVFASVCMP